MIVLYYSVVVIVKKMELGIVTLLRAAWLAAILPILVASIPSSRLNFVYELVLGFAQRGKIMQSSSKKFSVPQRFFCHFYVMGVIWTTLLLVTTWFYAYKMVPPVSEQSRKHTNTVWGSVFLLLLMEAQVLRRSLESLYVFKYSPSARMHILGYLTGFFFFIAAPLSLCCTFAPEMFRFVEQLVLDFIVEGKTPMFGLEFEFLAFLVPIFKVRWYVWVGVAIFLWGWIHQLRCHRILGSLRENTKQVEEYKIPYGDWFEYVSSPHYLADIVIYGGIAIASGGADLTIWLIFAFTVANLVFAAAETQRWYLHKFDNYPKNRFAIIPFVY